MTPSRPLVATLSFLCLTLAGCDKGGSKLPSEPEFTGSLSGTVTAEQVGIQGVTVRLVGAVVKEAQSSSGGTFSFSGLSAGTYQVSLTSIPDHIEFGSMSQTVSVQKGNPNPRADFIGSVKRDGRIFGLVILEGVGHQDATVTLSGPEGRAAQTDGQGAFSFTGLKRGGYTVTLSGFDPLLHAFSQTVQNVTATKDPGSEVRFEGTLIPQPPAPPSGLSASATGSRTVLLGWTDESSDETRFEVHRKMSPDGAWSLVGAPDPNGTGFEDVGLEPATTYSYRVRSCNDAGCSTFTEEVEATTPDVPPGAPTGLTVGSTGPYGLDLVWTAGSVNETRFEVERRSGVAGTWSLVHTLAAGVTTVSDGSLTPNTAYLYRVRACNDVGCSAYSSEAGATTDEIPPSPPTSASASALGSSAVVVAWADNSHNETRFEVERKVGSGSAWERVTTTNADAVGHTDSGLTPNTLYTYRVRACNAVGCSAFSNETSATTDALPPEAPTNLTANPTGPFTVDLAWSDGSANEARFEVEQKQTSGSSWTAGGTIDPNTTTFEATGLTPVTEYTFRVRACNDVGCSPFSNEATATTGDAPPAPPSGLGATATGPESIDLSWTDESDNETGFRVERKESAGGTWSLAGTAPANGSGLSDTGLTPSTAYVYRVQACNAEGCSAYSGEAGESTPALPPAVPTGLTATATGSSSVNLNWTDESADEAYFKVERKTGAGGTYAQITALDPDSNAFADSGLASSTTYFYRVSACHSGGCSTPSNEASATTDEVPPDAPSSLTATATGTETVDLGWTDNSGNETGFKVERKTEAGADPFVVVATVGPNVTSTTDGGLTANTTYRYRVLAYNAAGNSSYSAEVTETTWAGSGPNLTIDGAYITQSTQTYTGDVPLVADRDGYLRVFAIASEANSLQPDVRVRLYHSGSWVHTEILSAPGASTPTTAEESNLSYSWNTDIAGSLIQPGLSILVDVDPTNAIAEGNETDNDFPVGGSPQAIDVRTTAPFDVTFIPVRQSANNLVGDVSSGNASQFLDVTMRMLPIVQADVTLHAEYVTDAPALENDNDNDAWSTILSEVGSLKVAESASGYYYGVVRTSYNSGVAGMGYIGWSAAIGWDYLPSGSGVAAHEWGHNFNLRHAPGCGAGNTDPTYPYADGKIGVWGLDLTTFSLKSPAGYYDFMTYCGPDWVSDFFYEKILEYRQAHDGGGAPPQPEPSLLVWGRVEADRIILEPAFQVMATPTVPDGSGSFRLDAVDEGGRLTYSGAFDPTPVSDSPAGNGHFAFAIPLRSLGGTPLSELRVSGGGRQEASRLRGPEPVMTAPADLSVAPAAPGSLDISWDAARYPMAMVRDARTGQVLSFARGGRILLPTQAAELEITLSNGVTSPDRTLHRIR